MPPVFLFVSTDNHVVVIAGSTRNDGEASRDSAAIRGNKLTRPPLSGVR